MMAPKTIEIAPERERAQTKPAPAPKHSRKTLQTVIKWGSQAITLGGDAPVRVQSMTNTNTADDLATALQVKELALAGSELVRITVDTEQAAAAVPRIRERLDRMGLEVPLIGDFHFNGHRLLKDYPECAQTLSKYRINPGNVGRGQKKDLQFAQLIEAALRWDKPVRIGVNWGSLDPELLAQLMDANSESAAPAEPRVIMKQALIDSALNSAKQAEQLGMASQNIILSCKVSGVQDLVELYRELAGRCNYALHLGLTEAGMGLKGTVSSSAALAILLQEGIGETIRVSLTPQPGQKREQEALIAMEILQALGLRYFAPSVCACPGCGRTSSHAYQQLASQIDAFLSESMTVWRSLYPGVERLNVAVMGCIVNGPGESRHADVGISLPGSGEGAAAPVFIDGKKAATLRGDSMAQEFMGILERYVQERFGKESQSPQGAQTQMHPKPQEGMSDPAPADHASAHPL